MPKTIVITGASDGIGAAAALLLSQKGERVVIVGRDPQRTAAVAKEVGAPYFLADFADLSQVRTLAEQLLKQFPEINVLANNAGGIMGNRTLTVDGYEKTFQVNHLAPFLLTSLLLPALEAGKATVIQTSSKAASLFARFNIDDLQNENDYTPQKAYGNGKLANILFTRELHHRFADKGIAAVAFHPGIVGTSFASDTTNLMRYIYHSPLKHLFTIRPEKAAQDLVWLAEGTPAVTFTPGEYYESKKLPTRVNPVSMDAALAKELWDRSAALI
ncbi:short-chain dehydrogenase [Arthrobacter psychrolactophilus]|uniref:Short-chain dehydrogenase n=1 Tax=Arthrobacter psychrolactophilus TaxID=92442 RepID=A0A2V5IZH5_9MICC|nr:SDR family NAD(P)-dependent oxidoreductase [Arthrobacter psychrolactophilus]PYI39903.1 short-chain dehydrogenase [Arthrobacter psychrolactophilus]